MGRGDPKQKQLSFETTMTFQLPRSPLGSEGVPDQATADPPLDGTVAIMSELCAGFRAIDSSCDSLTHRFDTMNERLEHHGTRIEGAEHKISQVQDHTTTTKHHCC